MREVSSLRVIDGTERAGRGSVSEDDTVSITYQENGVSHIESVRVQQFLSSDSFRTEYDGLGGAQDRLRILTQGEFPTRAARSASERTASQRRMSIAGPHLRETSFARSQITRTCSLIVNQEENNRPQYAACIRTAEAAGYYVDTEVIRVTGVAPSELYR